MQNPATFTADFPVGTQWIVVSTRSRQGSSIRFFKLEVEAKPGAEPAKPKPARLTLAG